MCLFVFFMSIVRANRLTNKKTSACIGMCVCVCVCVCVSVYVFGVPVPAANEWRAFPLSRLVNYGRRERRQRRCKPRKVASRGERCPHETQTIKLHVVYPYGLFGEPCSAAEHQPYGWTQAVYQHPPERAACLPRYCQAGRRKEA